MHWFKHTGVLRNSPQMQHIFEKQGHYGTSCAYRLMEVLTQRSGSGKKFNPVLMLAAPYTLKWLAKEVIGQVWDESYGGYGGMRAGSENEIIDLLNLFTEAGLTVIKNLGNGEHTVTLANFDEMQDTWTARHQHAGTGKGGANQYGKIEP